MVQIHRSVLAQLTLPIYSRHAIAQDGTGKYRVYDVQESSWADEAVDGNLGRDSAEVRAAIFEEIAAFFATEEGKQLSGIYHFDDDEEGAPTPETCWECERHCFEGQMVTAITVDHDPGSAESGPDPNVGGATIHRDVCLARYLARTGIRLERALWREPAEGLV